MYTLENNQLSLTFSAKGAELKSIKDKKGREWLWQGNPDVWAGQAPLLFPIIGRLQNESYNYLGKTYQIPKHGFARDLEFTVDSSRENQLTFTLRDTPDTLKMYPFSFILSVTYSLDGTNLKKTHTVTNESKDAMYYELGGHDGLNVPFSSSETMNDCHYYFKEEEFIHPYDLDENCMLLPKKKEIPLTQGQLGLKPSAFSLDCLILDDLKEKYVELQDGQNRTRIQLNFKDFPILTLWTTDKVDNTNYVCIEPWTTLPDGTFMGRDITEKQGICKLDGNSSAVYAYDVTFFFDEM